LTSVRFRVFARLTRKGRFRAQFDPSSSLKRIWETLALQLACDTPIRGTVKPVCIDNIVPMPRLHRSTLPLVGLATIAVVAWLIIRPIPSLSNEEQILGPNSPITMGHQTTAFPPAATTAAVVAAVPPPLGPSAPSVPSLALRVDAWAHSTAPQDAMRAYEAVADCLQARVEDRVPQDQLEAGDSALSSVVGPERVQALQSRRHHAVDRCQDLRSDQIESRIAWLKRAAAAGVPGAALAFEVEGPDGQGALGGGSAPLPAPDAWYEERDAYIAQGLQHCDRTLAGSLGVAARPPGVSIAQAMTFWADKLQCAGDSGPLPTPLSEDPLAVAYLRHMGRGEPIAPADGSLPSE